MTALEAAALLVTATRDVSLARHECESWRTLAIKAIQEYANLARESAMAARHRQITERLRAERDELMTPRHSDRRAA